MQVRTGDLPLVTAGVVWYLATLGHKLFDL